MLRLAITGCHGRMGKSLVQTIVNDKEVKLTVATVSPNNPLMALDVGTIAGTSPLHFKPVENLADVMDHFDTLIDFTSPNATLSHLKLCQQHDKKVVIGTTGFNAEQKYLIDEASRDIPIVFAPNMSVGVNLCFELLKQAAKILKNSVDIEIIEAHHSQKVDAPSGTALKMGEVISDALGNDLNTVAIFGRQGITGKRNRHTIGFSSIRGGDIVGDHTVMFASEGERIEITHRASSRATFANGAIRAAKWLEGKKEGLFTMTDVLFENNS